MHWLVILGLGPQSCRHVNRTLAMAGQPHFGRRVGSVALALSEREFRRYRDCGILAHGFARARCADCGHDFIVAYSCKGQVDCPYCTTRRMAETAAQLIDLVFPRVPVRHWVLSFPKRLRYHLDNAGLQNAVLHSFLNAIQGMLQGLADARGECNVRLGAVVFKCPSSNRDRWRVFGG